MYRKPNEEWLPFRFGMDMNEFNLLCSSVAISEFCEGVRLLESSRFYLPYNSMFRMDELWSMIWIVFLLPPKQRARAQLFGLMKDGELLVIFPVFDMRDWVNGGSSWTISFLLLIRS